MNEIFTLFQSSEFLLNAFMLVGAGAVSGILAGLLGIGGGAVMVPVLYEFFGFMGVDEAVRTHIAVATSLGVIVPTSIRSFSAHYKKGLVDFDVLKIWFIPIIIGVIAGVWVMDLASGSLLRAIFAFQTLLIALLMIFNKDNFQFSANLPGKIAMISYGFFIGIVSKLMGIGGGILGSSFMTLFGRSIHQAVSTSAGLGLIISIPAVVGDLFFVAPNPELLPIGTVGYVNILAVLLMIPVSILCAPMGVKIAHSLPKRTLEMAFAVFLLSVAARFFISLF